MANALKLWWPYDAGATVTARLYQESALATLVEAVTLTRNGTVTNLYEGSTTSDISGDFQINVLDGSGNLLGTTSAANVTAGVETILGKSAVDSSAIADAVLREVVADHSAVSGSVAAYLALIGSGSITVTSALAADGTTLTLIQGDSYENDQTRALTFTGASADVWPDLTSAEVKIGLRRGLNLATEVAGTVVTPTGTQVVRFDLSKVKTDIEPGDYFYDVRAKLSDGDLVTLVQGEATVEPSAVAKW